MVLHSLTVDREKGTHCLLTKGELNPKLALFLMCRLLRYKSTEWALEKQDVMSVCFNRAGTQLFTMQKHLPPTVFDIWNREPCYSFTSSDGGYRNSVTMKSGCFAGPRDEVQFKHFGSLVSRLYCPAFFHTQ